MTTSHVPDTDRPAPDRAALRPRRQRPARSARTSPGLAAGLWTAAQVMDRRPPVADQDTSLWSSWGRLRGAENGHLVVVDRHVRPVGVLDSRDLALHWPRGPFDAHRTPLRRLLVGRPQPRAKADDDVATVARAMLTARTDALPVVDDDGRLLGLVTARHCVRLIAFRTAT
jgi:CBS domain-containing protein